jgi:hypothetical protein
VVTGEYDPVTGEEYPPQVLADLRNVRNGNVPPGHWGRSLQRMFEEQPMKFMDRLLKAEADWMEYVVSRKGKGSGGAVSSDAGSARVRELAVEILSRVRS